MSEIPYYFETPVPLYFRQTGWFESEYMFKFVTWAFAKCQNVPHKEIYYGREILLVPFEFIAGRLTSPKECFLSENIFRNQINALVNVGILTKTNNSLKNKYSCYVWNVSVFSKQAQKPSKGKQPTDNQQGTLNLTNRITNNNNTHNTPEEGFSDIDNQQNNQQITNRQQKNNHKQEQREQDVFVLVKETSKEDFVVPLPLSDEQKKKQNASPEEIEGVFSFLELVGHTTATSVICRWIKSYGVERLVNNINLVLKQKTFKDFGASVTAACKEDYAKQADNALINREFAIKFKATNNIVSLKINKKYCVDVNGNDYQYTLDTEQFKRILTQKFIGGA